MSSDRRRFFKSAQDGPCGGSQEHGRVPSLGDGCDGCDGCVFYEGPSDMRKMLQFCKK